MICVIGAADEDRCFSLHPVGNCLQVSMNSATFHTRAEINNTLMTHDTRHNVQVERAFKNQVKDLDSKEM